MAEPACGGEGWGAQASAVRPLELHKQTASLGKEAILFPSGPLTSFLPTHPAS